MYQYLSTHDVSILLTYYKIDTYSKYISKIVDLILNICNCKGSSKGKLFWFKLIFKDV